MSADPVDVVVFGYNDIYQNRIKPHLFDSAVSLKEAKARFLCNEWGGQMWYKCYKRELFQGVVFPQDIRVIEDLWVTGELIVKAKSIGFIDKYLYNYRRTNYDSLLHTPQTLDKYWFAVIMLHNNNLLKQAGLPKQDIGNAMVLKQTLDALRSAEEDGLTAEQIDELEDMRKTFLKLFQEDPHMSSHGKFKAYHALAKYAKAKGDYGQTLLYYWRYAVNKMKYLLQRAGKIKI